MSNQFLLPDELGWGCNDEISAYLNEWMLKTAKVTVSSDGKIDQQLWSLCKAELMDDVYAIIKKHQNLVKPPQQKGKKA